MNKLILALALCATTTVSASSSGLLGDIRAAPTAKYDIAEFGRRLTEEATYTEEVCEDIDIHRYPDLESCCDDLGLPEFQDELTAYLSDSVSAETMAPLCAAAGFCDPAGLVAILGQYPTSTGTHPTGTVTVTKTGGGILLASTNLANVDSVCSSPCGAANCCGIHIHSGTTCDDAALVGGHFFPSGISDPWAKIEYDTPGGTTANPVSHNMSGFSTCNAVPFPVENHVVVVHDAYGARLACGKLEYCGPAGLTAELGPYPGYSGTLTVTGTVTVTETSTGIVMASSNLAGLPASVTTTAGIGNELGFHIHTGMSCEDTSLVGNHLYGSSPGCDVATDPWGTAYWIPSDGAGNAAPSLSFAGYGTCSGTCPVIGRVAVIHDASGARVACGVLKPAA
jgi:Cu/Zn superoxide dismutase